MTETEIREKVSQTHIVVFGVEGQGGLVRKVESVEKLVATHEARLNTISYKWLALMMLVGVLGNALGQKLVSLMSFFKILAP